MRILVGLSGGVDSAAAARLLLSAGHQVEGATLVMHEHTELDAAREAASGLGIRLHEIDCSELFDSVVKDNFVSEYLTGRTPNPCIICNEKVKFRCLYDYARSHGFDKIATGHYARVISVTSDEGTRYSVAVSDDPVKDQSYMLSRLPQDILSMLLLPLADKSKPQVREYAGREGLVAADRPDSQEICFLPEGNYAEYIESIAGKCPEGDFVSEDGLILGRHKGIIRYTVGQRKGLGISLGERMFVTDIDAYNNTVTLSPIHSGKSEIRIRDTVLSGALPVGFCGRVKALVKLRYTASAREGEAMLNPDGTALISFSEPVKAAPGQSAVGYIDGAVAFSGFIL